MLELWWYLGNFLNIKQCDFDKWPVVMTYSMMSLQGCKAWRNNHCWRRCPGLGQVRPDIPQQIKGLLLQLPSNLVPAWATLSMTTLAHLWSD